MPSPSTTETPSGSSQPYGSGKLASGRPSSRPISRPSVSPMMAVTNSPADRSETLAMIATRRLDRDVGQDRVAHHEPGHQPARGAAGSPRADRSKTDPRGTGARSSAMARMSPRLPPSNRTKRCIGPRLPERGPVTPYPEGTEPDPIDRASASRSVSHRDDPELATRDPAMAGPSRSTSSPAGTMACRKPSRAASRRRRSRPWTGRSSPSSDTSPQATVPGAQRARRGPTTRAPGRPAGRARVPRRSRPRRG